MNQLANLGIDFWSILLYLVNVGILLAILNKYVYRPLLKYLDERRHLIKKNITESEELKRKFTEEAAKQEKTTAELVRNMQFQTIAAKRAAETKAKQILAEAESQKERILAEAQTEIDRLKRGLVDEVEQELLERMERTVMTVLQNRVPEQLVSESVATTWAEIKKQTN